MRVTNRDIIAAIEEVAPLTLQESWDNSGWQVGNPDAPCTGALLCVDVTDEIIDEALDRHCNLIVAHHPLIFKGIKQITGRNRVERCIARCFVNGISVYSSHTAIDCAPHGVSIEMAMRLGLDSIEPLEPNGLGAVGNLPQPLNWRELVDKVKSTFSIPAVKVSRTPEDGAVISRVAMCGGAGGDLIPAAIGAGAQAFITADTKLNQFIDYRDDILLIDAGHFETEQCTKDLFYWAISKKFPNFALWKSDTELPPVLYM